MEFDAECRHPRLSRRHRPGNVHGLFAALAALGFLASVAPPGLRYAERTYDALKKLAQTGFTPENAREAAAMAETAAAVMAVTFLTTLASIALWLILKDLFRIFRGTFMPSSRDARRGEVAGVHYGPMTVVMNDTGLSLSADLSRSVVPWAAIDSAELRHGALVLTLGNGATCVIPAAGAPGGARAALDHVRAAIAGATEEPAG